MRDGSAASLLRRKRFWRPGLASIAILDLGAGFVIGQGIDWTDRARFERLVASMTADPRAPAVVGTRLARCHNSGTCAAARPDRAPLTRMAQR
ncbi:hypothetical protein [Sphingomonas sp. ERG5]|uniref:hypothetical protein n=1 Tax=Sphingomonas sp. ERG5 TaxID=1381597 RepID=UPI001364CFBB|nr:hypothetical protein [Sphingomonas sp. ERG5]